MISESLTSSGGKLTVQATVFADGETREVSWTSTDDDPAWAPVD
jgi:hypothetical protein